jgi:hypothetical protein
LAGLVNVTLSVSFAHSIAGFALVGLGTACIVPAGFALAPRLAPATAAAAISTLSIIGAPFRIITPMAYGALAGATSFSFGYSVYALLAMIAFFLALSMLKRTQTQVAP